MPGLDLNRLTGIMGVDFFLHGGVEARAVGALDPEGVARHQRLAEGHQPAALRGRLLDAPVTLARVFSRFSQTGAICARPTVRES